ncbi:MAG: glycosyltransferase [Bacteroidia bacterium]|nr:glycosyltransferase [Bacteroidia bacterium]MCX7652521.1 glycosyltransferase [Bacteroidia bacterium]
MPPIRVLHLARVINRYDFIDTVVRHLPREKFVMEVATFEFQSNIQPPNYAQIGISHHVIPISHIRSYPTYVKAAFSLAKLLRDRKIDILHTHHFWEGIVGAIAKKIYPGVKLIIHRHYTEDITRLRGWKMKLLLQLERFSYRQADRLVVPTRTIHNFIKSLHRGRLPEIVEIPYGFDFEAEKYQPLSPEERSGFRHSFGISEHACVITNVGSHRLQKGQMELLQAFTQLSDEVPQVYLWLVGDGPDSARLREMAEPLGEKVRFWGWQRSDMVRLLMGASDIIAHPSYSEAFPQVMVEALALERALLITQVSGAIETLKHEETAWLIPPMNVEGLYRGLKILVSSAELRRKMGEAGRKQILAQLYYQVINTYYESLYAKLCSPSA